MAKKFAPQYPSELRQNIGVYPRFLSAPAPALSPVHVLHVSSLATPQADDICRDILLQTIKLFCSNYDAPLTFTLQFVGYLIAAGKVGDRESEIGNDSPLQASSNQIGTDVMEFGQIMESRGHRSTGKLKMTEFSILSSRGNYI